MASSLLDHNVDKNTLAGLIHSLAPELGITSDNSLMFQLLADNPQLLLNPEFQNVMRGLLEAAARHEMKNYLVVQDPAELLRLLQVSSEWRIWMVIITVWITKHLTA